MGDSGDRPEAEGIQHEFPFRRPLSGPFPLRDDDAESIELVTFPSSTPKPLKHTGNTQIIYFNIHYCIRSSSFSQGFSPASSKPLFNWDDVQTVTSSIYNISFIHIQVLSHHSARSWKPPPGIWRRSGRGQSQRVRTGNRTLCYRSFSWPKPAFPQQCTHLKDHQYVRNPVRTIETYSFTLLVLWGTRGSFSIWADLVTAASVKSWLDVDDAVLGAVKDQAGVLTGVCGVET